MGMSGIRSNDLLWRGMWSLFWSNVRYSRSNMINDETRQQVGYLLGRYGYSILYLPAGKGKLGPSVN